MRKNNVGHLANPFGPRFLRRREGGFNTSNGREKDVKLSREGSYKLDSQYYNNPESVRST